MLVVTDRGLDLALGQLNSLEIHFAPLWLHLNERVYNSGVDIQPAEFYRKLSETSQYPTTSMATVQDFTDLYQRLAQLDPKILSIHVSAELSGTYQAAHLAARLVPEAEITVVDSGSLSALLGWQVECAVKAVRAGWPMEKILAFLHRLRNETFGIFTVKELRYLVHSGRLGFLQGMLASMLDIKPVIMINQMTGRLESHGKEMTFRRAIANMVGKISRKFGREVPLRAQIVHGDNLPGVEMLQLRMEEVLNVQWEPVTPISPVLGAHSGPSIVGVAVARADLFSDLNG